VRGDVDQGNYIFLKVRSIFDVYIPKILFKITKKLT
jgi:hypothetical protein